jgi:hypothetical protein
MPYATQMQGTLLQILQLTSQTIHLLSMCSKIYCNSDLR